jgi:predicted dehydrogenase
MTVIYRAAIVGTGRIGHTYDDEVTNRKESAFYQGENRHTGLYTVLPVNHAEAYLTTSGFELVAAANRGEGKLRAFGERRGVRALYTDFREMLRQERPDVVSVCTQSPEKAEVTIAAAEAGAKAVIVEKAFATSMAEADAMIAACEQNGTLLVINHPQRFSPQSRRAKELADGGAIGEITSLATYHRSGMLHGGTHTFDMLRYIAGDVARIEARVPDYAPEKDLPAYGMLWFESGAIGFFDHAHGVHPELQVRGTNGSLVTSGFVGDGWLRQVSLLFPESVRKHPYQVSVEPIEGEPHTISPTQRLLTEVHQSLTDGTPFVSTGRDGAAALELGLACYVSHLAGGPIDLPLADRSFRVPNR